MIADALKYTIKGLLADPRRVAVALGLDTKGANRREERQAGGGLKVCCPWHSEKHPSCSLTRGRDGTLRVHCFTCDNGGDVFSLLAAVRGLSLERDFAAVLREAGELVGVNTCDDSASRPLAARHRQEAPPFAPKAPAPICAADRAFGALVAPLLHLGQLDASSISADVCAYLDGRGLLDLARAEGWAALPAPESGAAPSWCRMLRDVARGLADDLDVPRALVEAELAQIARADGEGFWHCAHRLVIPFRSPEGVIYTWQRRSLDDRRDKYVFPRSRDAEEGPDARAGRGRSARWPYGVERLAAAPADAPIAFTEGALDAAALRALDAADGRNRIVLGVPGIGAWGDGFFATYAAQRVAVVATDDDRHRPPEQNEGEKAAKRWGADLWRAGAKDVERERPTASKDWAEALAGVTA